MTCGMRERASFSKLASVEAVCKMTSGACAASSLGGSLASADTAYSRTPQVLSSSSFAIAGACSVSASGGSLASTSNA